MMGVLLHFPASRTEQQLFSDAWQNKPVEQWTSYDDICEARWQIKRLGESVKIAEAAGATRTAEYIVDSAMLEWWGDELARLSGVHECEVVRLARTV